jgi:lipopolysaccharide biosynthesis glycosyltransferase
MLNVVVATDDNYSNLVMVSLTSLLENNSEDFNLITIYILDDNINETNKNKISDLTKKYSCKIEFIPTKNFESTDIKFDSMNHDGAISLTTYSRLFIPSLLPKNIDKIIYLDCDAITLGSFKDLCNIDIENYYCAAVLDTLAESVLESIHEEYSEGDSYVNGGFLLINLKKWREDAVEEKFIEYLSKNQGKYTIYDQGAINAVFKDKILILEPKYNLQMYFQYCDYDLAKLLQYRHEYYTKEILDDSKKNPIFIHFPGLDINRPWRNKYHPFHDEFKKYAKMANCEEVMQYIDLTLKQKLAFKLCKYKLFNYIFKLSLSIIR